MTLTISLGENGANQSSQPRQEMKVNIIQLGTAAPQTVSIHIADMFLSNTLSNYECQQSATFIVVVFLEV